MKNLLQVSSTGVVIAGLDVCPELLAFIQPYQRYGELAPSNKRGTSTLYHSIGVGSSEKIFRVTEMMKDKIATLRIFFWSQAPPGLGVVLGM